MGQHHRHVVGQFLGDDASTSTNASLQLAGPVALWIFDLTEILSDTIYPAGQNFDVMTFHSYSSRDEAIRRMSYVRSELARADIERPIWNTEARRCRTKLAWQGSTDS